MLSPFCSHGGGASRRNPGSLAGLAHGWQENKAPFVTNACPQHFFSTPLSPRGNGSVLPARSCMIPPSADKRRQPDASEGDALRKC